MEGVRQGDSRQIDGLGGATSLNSKVAIISLSDKEDTDLDYFFVQVVIGKGKISTTQTCGNILAGVVPFAVECGMIKANNPTTSARVNIVNTGGICEVTIQTPDGKVNYAGDAKVDGVPGTAATIICNYLGTAGSTCGTLLPTGNVKDIVDEIEVTCIDNGMPVVIIRASDLDITGYEMPTELDANKVLKNKFESIRLQIGKRMNLGDVQEKTVNLFQGKTGHIARVHTALNFTDAAPAILAHCKAHKTQTQSRPYKRAKTTNARPTHSS